jgi:hypothetical protein
MARGHRRTYITIALLAALFLAAAAAAACSAQATAGSSPLGAGPSAATSGSPGTATGAKGGSTGDWSRVLAALASMRATTPTGPVVVLLGGSAARESTISDESWRSQIIDKGGPATLAWNMGSSDRTMAQNVAVVKALPPGAHVIVFVGINLGAFTSAQKTAAIKLPSPAPAEVPLHQHHQYSTKTGILSPAKKQAMLQNWLTVRYPVFKRNFSNSAAVLETLIKTCQARGYKPVLFELPRNTQIIGSALNAPTTKFRTKCAALHKKYDVPWIPLLTSKIPSTSFYDLWHLVEPGRTVWQDLLSARTAALLTKYGYDGGGS